MSLEHTPCPHNMQTSKFNDDIIPFQVTFRGLQLVSQLYLPTKWPWIAKISSGNYDEVVITTPLQYHCMISSQSSPILGRQRLGQPNLPALDLKHRWDSTHFTMGFESLKRFEPIVCDEIQTSQKITNGRGSRGVKGGDRSRGEQGPA